MPTLPAATRLRGVLEARRGENVLHQPHKGETGGEAEGEHLVFVRAVAADHLVDAQATALAEQTQFGPTLRSYHTGSTWHWPLPWVLRLQVGQRLVDQLAGLGRAQCR